MKTLAFALALAFAKFALALALSLAVIGGAVSLMHVAACTAGSPNC
jgi:hypothetical protein